MLSILFGLALASSVTREATNYQFDITIYQGHPEGSKEKGDVAVLSRPRIITRSHQQALISVGQQVPVISDIKREVGKKVITVSDMQVGTILKLLPKGQQDGSVFVSGDISISEVVSDSAVHVRSLTFHELFQPGETRIITFYNPQSFETQTIGPDGVKVRKKIYSGHEMWMEVKLVENQPTMAKPIQAVGKLNKAIQYDGSHPLYYLTNNKGFLTYYLRGVGKEGVFLAKNVGSNILVEGKSIPATIDNKPKNQIIVEKVTLRQAQAIVEPGTHSNSP